MPSRLPKKIVLALAGLSIAIPVQSFAKPHGARGYGPAMPGAWQGGRYGYRPGYVAGYPIRQGYAAYRGYPVYGGYRPYRAYGYPVYGGYPGYYYGHHHYHNDGAWIAVGAGLVGVALGAMIARPRAYYYYPYPQATYPQQQPQPQMQQCPDGSTIPVGSYCPAQPAPAQSYPAEPPIPRG